LRVPDSLLSCVTFVSRKNPQLQVDYIGTALIVGVRGKWGHAYLHAVTAKHVAVCVEGNSALMGANFKDGQMGWFESGPKWWYHPTEPDTVDAAATIFTPTERFDVQHIPETIFATDERIKQYGIGVGDEVNVVGLFSGFLGTKRLTPIVRTGNIAMMPLDKFPVPGGEADAYLVEGRSIGGLSGSPAFVRHTISMDVRSVDDPRPQKFSGAGQLSLLGLMHGHWDLPVGFRPEQIEAVNMGVAIVVPAKKILEVLYHPELIALRAEQDQLSLRQQHTSP
jgi:hypothetical protein